MTMTVTQLIIVGFMIILGTTLTRFLPFLIFPADKPTPRYARYLGGALPVAVLGMLVIYCLKDVNVLAGSRGMPEFISVAAVVLLHLRRRQMLLSIAAGTVLYMFLIQFIFQ